MNEETGFLSSRLFFFPLHLIQGFAMLPRLTGFELSGFGTRSIHYHIHFIFVLFMSLFGGGTHL